MIFTALAAAAAAASAMLAASGPTDDAVRARLSAAEIDAYLQPVKPRPVATPVQDDSCAFSLDRTCDEPGFGTGRCDAGTDYSDCWRIMEGREDDSCQWANDGECDEPAFGSGACTMGTDLTDCGEVSHLRFQDDSCRHAFNGVCEAIEDGSGRCDPRTDRSDCVGRERPARIHDHFFGYDDRVLPPVDTAPWTAVGAFFSDDGGSCTAALVAPAVIVTAAHCVTSDSGGVFAAGRFELADRTAEADVIDFFVDPEWDVETFDETNDEDGLDWVLLRLDAALGSQPERRLPPARLDPALPLVQAGYSWDTDPWLSGNLDCSVRQAFADSTFAHDCDTTRGDSGSPFLQRQGGAWVIVGTDSNFRQDDGEPVIYIAAQAAGWMDYLPAFAAGEIGEGGVRPRGRGKPVPPPAKPR